MAYGRETLRKAGQSLMDFDAKYAARAEKDMGGAHNAPLKTALGGTALKDIGELEADSWYEAALGYGLMGGAAATNIGYRYGLPAAGLTLAGKGLYDLTNSMSQQTDSTLSPGT